VTDARDHPVGTVTFLFTDIEGSTRLVRTLRGRYDDVLEQHRRILRRAFADHDGREVDTQGDSFFAAFGRARDAAGAAIQAQRSLLAESWPDNAAVRVRMGLHTSEPQLGESGYHGIGVVRGARVCGAAQGGQIICSDSTRTLLEDDALDGLEFRDLGSFVLKGLERPERLHQLVVPGLSDVVAAPLAEPADTDAPRFRLLGPLEAYGESGPLALGGHKQRMVLAVLLLNAERVVSTDQLLAALWDEEPPKTAATSLQNFISQLRKLLGHETLVTQPPGYVLRVPPQQIDVHLFADRVEAARTADPADRVDALRASLNLWRGPPLADFTYERFAESEIGRLDELRLAAIEQRIDAEIELGLHADVIGELEGLVAENPLRERLPFLLMLALYRSGRQAEALQVYQKARRTLLDELGLEPSPALQELHTSIIRQDSSLRAAARSDDHNDHYDEVTRAMLQGRLVPVLGADVGQLALQLAERFDYPEDDRAALARVSQYVAVMSGSGPLYDELHACLDIDAPPTALHRLFASLPPLLRERNVPQQLLVSTSYDLALEQALLDAGEEFDVVTYLAAGPHRGRFCHVAPDGTSTPILRPNEYVAELSLEQRTVLLKLHGQVDRMSDREWESFVVTEDDYIDYLDQTDVSNSVPVALAARLRRSHFLFLGYRMSDWNLRVILNRLWGDNPLTYRSWAVHAGARPLEREFWRHRNVEVLDAPLEDYARALARTAGLDAAESPA
jgi:DNA-binding SARP family transcriptional activator/class 3 adenylate cyclase